jgi:hypothetical protein
MLKFISGGSRLRFCVKTFLDIIAWLYFNNNSIFQISGLLEIIFPSLFLDFKIFSKACTIA